MLCSLENRKERKKLLFLGRFKKGCNKLKWRTRTDKDPCPQNCQDKHLTV